MTRMPSSGNASARIIRYFDQCAIDCTPVAVSASVRVLFAPFLTDTDNLRAAPSVLSKSERIKAAVFLTEDVRDRFIQRRVFLRYCVARARGELAALDQIRFETAVNGKPSVADMPGTCFSFSSCRLGFLGAWSSTCDVGVDIEDLNGMDDAQEMALYFFAPAEAAALTGLTASARRLTFSQLWTLKEAALKSVGEGLPLGLDAFECELVPSLRFTRVPAAYGRPDAFEGHAIEGTGGCACVVMHHRASSFDLRLDVAV